MGVWISLKSNHICTEAARGGAEGKAKTVTDQPKETDKFCHQARKKLIYELSLTSPHPGAALACLMIYEKGGGTHQITLTTLR